ncbi:MAG TPA: hypothetical protein VFO93_02105 [Hymenobacter sp.]|uniref:hypothetical protein n=1 Tax=Hymenobacter sp. TaxID=1898978 RepID=UPI002D7E72DA|nr:hypothetical protein [Hymenobacter sp.]HET9502305.1 hypothetical protein [Hymenobacter sp.]
MRNSLFSLTLLGGLVAGSHTASAQYDPNVAQRVVRPLELWPELQAELALKNSDYLLLVLHGERGTGQYAVRNPPLGFDTRRALVAYEHFWNLNWSWGGTLRYEADGNFETNSYYSNLVVPEVVVRHRSTIFGGLTFGQRLGVERQFLVSRQPLGFSAPDGQFWTRLRVDVERLFPLGAKADGLALRPRLSYMASTHLRLQKDDNAPAERTIQWTSLRAEVGVRLSSVIDFTPWFAYQTSYKQSLVFTDANGNPVSGGKTNYVFPTLGLDVRFTIPSAGGSGAKTDHSQLPTQH